MEFDGLTALAGLIVGTIVGITGVGGGALMTPILVLMFGVAPQTADRHRPAVRLHHQVLRRGRAPGPRHRGLGRGTATGLRQPAGRCPHTGVDECQRRRPYPDRLSDQRRGHRVDRHRTGHVAEGLAACDGPQAASVRRVAFPQDAASRHRGRRRAARCAGDAHVDRRRRARHRDAGVSVPAAAEREQAWWAPTWRTRSRWR